jgi:hypothetical protein
MLPCEDDCNQEDASIFRASRQGSPGTKQLEKYGYELIDRTWLRGSLQISAYSGRFVMASLYAVQFLKRGAAGNKRKTAVCPAKSHRDAEDLVRRNVTDIVPNSLCTRELRDVVVQFEEGNLLDMPELILEDAAPRRN